MPNPYPRELRVRAVRAYESRTEPYPVIAARFEIGPATLMRWVQRQRETGTVDPLAKGGGWVSPVAWAVLKPLIDAKPDQTCEELTRAYNLVAPYGRVHRSSIWASAPPPAPHDFFGQPSARRRMSYVQGKTAASWALVGTGRWSARRKVSVVIEVLKGESLESLSRRHGVTAAKLSQWRDDFVAGGEARLKHREVAVEGADTRRLKRVVADLATDKALLAEKIRHLEAGRPLGWWRSKR